MPTSVPPLGDDGTAPGCDEDVVRATGRNPGRHATLHRSTVDRMSLAAARRSATRWLLLANLLMRLERAVEACARLDARERQPSARSTHGQLVWSLDQGLRRLDRRMDAELDRVTAERLTLDLHEKMRREAVPA